jgi:hypothetical protein
MTRCPPRTREPCAAGGGKLPRTGCLILVPSSQAASTRAVSISVGCMNLVGCWFGAMPVCHGSGGLAAQQLFGANSGAAVIMLGASKLALSLLFGASLLPLLASFPRCILGAMLALAGVAPSLPPPSPHTRASTAFPPLR